MKIPDRTPHKIGGVELKEIHITNWPGEGLRLDASLAYVTKEGLTCGKLSVTSSLCSGETNDALSRLIELLEKDAASTVFDLSTNDEELSVLGTAQEPIRQI